MILVVKKPFCIAQLQELDDIPATLKDIVFVQEISCGQPIEKLYYAARFDNICVYCTKVVSPWSNDCSEKPPIENEKFKKKFVSCCSFFVVVFWYLLYNFFQFIVFFNDIHSNT